MKRNKGTNLNNPALQSLQECTNEQTSSPVAPLFSLFCLRNPVTLRCKSAVSGLCADSTRLLCQKKNVGWAELFVQVNGSLCNVQIRVWDHGKLCFFVFWGFLLLNQSQFRNNSYQNDLFIYFLTSEAVNLPWTDK